MAREIVDPFDLSVDTTLNSKSVPKSESNNLIVSDADNRNWEYPNSDPGPLKRTIYIGGNPVDIIRPNTEEEIREYEEARQKSLEERIAQDYDRDRRRTKAFIAIGVASAAALLSLAIGIGAHIYKIYKTNEDQTKYREEITEILSSYDDIMENTTVNLGNGEGDYYYRHNVLASRILASDNPELAFYTVYDRINWDKNGNMSEIIEEMLPSINDNNRDEFAWIRGCNDFDSYLIKKGCVDENGKPSMEKYEETMKTEIVDMAKELRQEKSK